MFWQSTNNDLCNTCITWVILHKILKVRQKLYTQKRFGWHREKNAYSIKYQPTIKQKKVQ